jgi:hypothetical protein
MKNLRELQEHEKKEQLDFAKELGTLAEKHMNKDNWTSLSSLLIGQCASISKRNGMTKKLFIASCSDLWDELEQFISKTGGNCEL